MPQKIVSNYSDIGLRYDISFVDVELFNVPSYGEIYLLTKNNIPQDIGMMIIDAVDRSGYFFLDCNPADLVDDVKSWFTHPENVNLTFTDSFWRKVEDFIYNEQQNEKRDAQDWEAEMHFINSQRQRELVNEYNYNKDYYGGY